MLQCDVAIIGAGAAGLSCARVLQDAQIDYQIIETNATVGGRIQSDRVDGYTLDRGFQVLLTAYPEAIRQLDYNLLALRRFAPGAVVRQNNQFVTLDDPLREPLSTLSTVRAPIGTFRDKLRIAKLRAGFANKSEFDIFHALNNDSKTTLQALQDEGFSAQMIQAFWMPLLGGITLEPVLSGTSRMRDFVFAMLSRGDAAVPANGMGAISEQLASHVDASRIHTSCVVQTIEKKSATYEVNTSGETVTARCVVIATDGDTARKLISDVDGALPDRAMIAPHGANGVRAIYFAADAAPTSTKAILLDGDHSGPINNASIISNVAPEYAPIGRHLIVAQVLGADSDIDIANAARRQFQTWWGAQVDTWTHLRTYSIGYAQPAQPPGSLTPYRRGVDLGNGLWTCGDHRDQASINGALASGRRCASALLAQLGAKASDCNL
jgi:phytoene dehydrogenase-like protein